MNLPLWPSSSDRFSFWEVLGVMTAIAAAMLIYFRRRNWL
jgi:Mg2+ and Co2+ transporter CorA